MRSVAGASSSTYARIGEKLLARRTHAPKPYLYIRSDGRVLVGTQSLHRTGPARVWRLFWRLKHKRIPGADAL